MLLGRHKRPQRASRRSSWGDHFDVPRGPSRGRAGPRFVPSGTGLELLDSGGIFVARRRLQRQPPRPCGRRSSSWRRSRTARGAPGGAGGTCWKLGARLGPLPTRRWDARWPPLGAALRGGEAFRRGGGAGARAPPAGLRSRKDPPLSPRYRRWPRRSRRETGPGDLVLVKGSRGDASRAGGGTAPRRCTRRGGARDALPLPLPAPHGNWPILKRVPLHHVSIALPRPRRRSSWPSCSARP